MSQHGRCEECGKEGPVVRVPIPVSLPRSSPESEHPRDVEPRISTVTVCEEHVPHARLRIKAMQAHPFNRPA